jgi:hypothetical protein
VSLFSEHKLWLPLKQTYVQVFACNCQTIMWMRSSPSRKDGGVGEKEERMFSVDASKLGRLNAFVGEAVANAAVILLQEL